MLQALYVLDADPFRWIYGPSEQAALAELVHIYAPPQTRETVAQNPAILEPAEIILSGWGAPLMDEAFLAHAPKLQAVFYGAGSIRGVVSDAFWQRGIRITSAWAANAVPVSEYALSQILFSLKRGWHYALATRREQKWPAREWVPGAFGSTVGVISLGQVGQMVCRRLQPFDLHILAYDPFATPELAQQLNVELVSLDEVFQRSDVVSLHTPWLKETEGMITGRHLAAMKPYATFINTARGAVVREGEMIEVLQQRPDLWAVLDVTYPEPPEPGSPLYTLPNVVMTPHIAGSMENECRRQGQYMVEELRRYLRDEPLKWGITRERAAIMA